MWLPYKAICDQPIIVINFWLITWIYKWRLKIYGVKSIWGIFLLNLSLTNLPRPWIRLWKVVFLVMIYEIKKRSIYFQIYFIFYISILYLFFFPNHIRMALKVLKVKWGACTVTSLKNYMWFTHNRDTIFTNCSILTNEGSKWSRG